MQSSKNIHFLKNRLTKEGKGGKIVKLSERAGTTERVNDKKRKNNLNFFKKGIDKWKRMWYNSQAAEIEGSERSLKIEQQREKYKA